MKKLAQICQISQKILLSARFLLLVPIGSQKHKNILIFPTYILVHVAKFG